MADLLFMNGYGIFVWPSYGIALIVWVSLILSSVFERRRVEKNLKALEALKAQK